MACIDTMTKTVSLKNAVIGLSFTFSYFFGLTARTHNKNHFRSVASPKNTDVAENSTMYLITADATIN